MNRTLVGLMMLLIATSCSEIFGQTASSDPVPVPTPKPAVKRRTFDQFDLSNGVNIATTNSAGPSFGFSKPATVEPVGERTYNDVRKLVEHVGAMGAEYKWAIEGKPADPHDYQPLSLLNRKLNAAYRVTDLLRDGVLDQKPLQHPSNRLLIEESQTTLREAMNTAAISGGWSKNEEMLAKMSAKYNAEPMSGIEETRRAVLLGMLARLNANFSLLLNHIAVQKP